MLTTTADFPRDSANINIYIHEVQSGERFNIVMSSNIKTFALNSLLLLTLYILLYLNVNIDDSLPVNSL